MSFRKQIQLRKNAHVDLSKTIFLFRLVYEHRQIRRTSKNRPEVYLERQGKLLHPVLLS